MPKEMQYCIEIFIKIFTSSFILTNVKTKLKQNREMSTNDMHGYNCPQYANYNWKATQIRDEAENAHFL